MRNKGFTLIELLVVVAIIGLIAVGAIPKLLSAIDKAKNATAKSDIDSLNTALRSYSMDNRDNSYPVSNESNISPALDSLLPDYLASLPRAPYESGTTNAYRYISDGFNYTLSVKLRDTDRQEYTLTFISNLNIYSEIR